MEGLKTSTHASLRSMLNQIVFSNMSQVKIFLGMGILGSAGGIEVRDLEWKKTEKPFLNSCNNYPTIVNWANYFVISFLVFCHLI